MKKYNRLIACSVMIWLLLALGIGYGINRQNLQQNTQYKVEINRLYHSLSGTSEPDKLELRSCEWVREVTFLPEEGLADEERVMEFYEGRNDMETEVRPVFQEGMPKGFVRFDYIQPLRSAKDMLWVVEAGLFAMEAFLLIMLLYLRHKVIEPFHAISRMPLELAKGHFKGFVKEERGKFFGQFLWGIGQLQETLEVSKKRTLQLEKEKKTLLLSLSHDIKTPLNTIRLYAKALEEDLYGNENDKKYAAHQIGAKSVEIERYVEEIMRHSREEILDIQVCSEEFYLSELMEKVLGTYGEKCAIRLVELEVAEYENCLLQGDLDKTVEVFENIFENAFKYGDGRRISISFSEEEECQLIRIFNTGEPVSENEMNHIFESFFRAANSEGKDGSGLGLYICREIMRKMGGSIFAQRCEDGMAFVLVL